MRSFLIAALIAALPACKSLSTFASGSEGEVTYGSDAESNLKLGQDALENKSYPEAQRYFEYVKTKYPFLEAAKVAELLLGDTDFERERFVEARDRYMSFVRLHPSHPKVDYAAFRAALTHYKDMPSDFIALPPSAEKDQVELRGAFSSMSEFLRNYPQSSHAAEAKTVLDDVKRRLADHELYVAGFYGKRDHWQAVVTRLSTVEKKYAGVGYDEKVAFGLFDAYRKLHDDDAARAALNRYVEKFPGTPGATRAQGVLSGMPVSVKPMSPVVESPDAG